MKIEEIRKPEEKILWQGSLKEKTAQRLALQNKWLKSALIAGSVSTLILFLLIVSNGVWETFLSPFGFLYPFFMAPVWIYLYKLFSSYSTYCHSRYCITDRGVYIQTGAERYEVTEMLHPERMRKVYTFRSDADIKNNVGTVVCEYDMGYIESETRGDTAQFMIHSIPEYNEVSLMINQLMKIRQAEQAQKTAQRETSEAEQFRAPKPLEYQPKYKYKRRAESLAEQGIYTDPDTVYAAASAQPAAVQQNAEPIAVQQNDSAVLLGDPQAAFFGDAQNMIPLPGEKPMFLDPDYASASEIMETLPDETVVDLQKELFGAHAEQQGAFPDPTVNPLPELSGQEDMQQGQFLQGV